MKKADVGALTILLEFDPYQIQGARLAIPLLGIDQHVTHLTQFDTLPAGLYDADITAFLTSGGETRQKVTIKILANQGNLHRFNLAVPHEILIRPVDSQDRTILFSEVKIENLDLNFRPLRDEKGVAYKLRPGEYKVKVVLPNLRVKTFPLKISEDVNVYTLPVEGRHAQTRREARIQLSVPIEYRTADGNWVSTKTVNVSSTGICLVKRKWNMDDENLYVRLFVPISSGPVECSARVRWVKDEGSGSSEMGLELFITDLIRESLVKWLAKSSSPSTIPGGKKS
ncbi:MAG TPA: PilZ domain-containing protein [Acidobacteriota bacterium]